MVFDAGAPARITIRTARVRRAFKIVDNRRHLFQIHLRSLQDHQFYLDTLPNAVAQGQALLAKASAEKHGQILSAMTDIVLGKDDTVAIRSQSAWVRRALRDFGRPRKRQWSTAAEKVRRVAFQLMTSQAYRHHVGKLLRNKDSLRSSLLRHRDDIDRQR